MSDEDLSEISNVVEECLQETHFNRLDTQMCLLQDKGGKPSKTLQDQNKTAKEALKKTLEENYNKLAKEWLAKKDTLNECSLALLENKVLEALERYTNFLTHHYPEGFQDGEDVEGDLPESAGFVNTGYDK